MAARHEAADRHDTPTTIERSPAAVLLVLAVLGAWFGDTVVAFASDLLRGLDAVPTWIVDVVLVGTRLLAVAVLGALLVGSLIGRRWRMLVTTLAAGATAGLLASL